MTRRFIYPTLFSGTPPVADPAPPVLSWFAPLNEFRKSSVIGTMLAAALAPPSLYIPQPPQVVASVVPALSWFQPLALPTKPTAKFFKPDWPIALTALPVVAAPTFIAVPLNEPVRPIPHRAWQSNVTFPPCVPAANPAPPALSWFAPLGQPVFAQVKYPTTRIQFPSWSFGAISVTDIWTPVVPGSDPWATVAGSTDIWTPQIPGAPTWTPQ